MQSLSRGTSINPVATSALVAFDAWTRGCMGHDDFRSFVSLLSDNVDCIVSMNADRIVGPAGRDALVEDCRKRAERGRRVEITIIHVATDRSGAVVEYEASGGADAPTWRGSVTIECTDQGNITAFRHYAPAIR